MYIVASAEVFRLWRIYPHLAFTSELDTLRWDMRSGFNERSSLSLFSEGSAYMMQTIASYMQRYRRGHNGADSKSVCAKSTRGFESLPLRQKQRTLRVGVLCFLLRGRGFSHCDECRRVRILRSEIDKLACQA